MEKTIDFGPVADLYDVYVQWDLDLPFFRDLCAETRGPVLELMSGTGRLSVPLLTHGVELVCVDYSAEMADVLKRRLREGGLSADVTVQDVRELDLGRTFPLILMPFHSIAEIVESEHRAEALRRIKAHLEPGGRFIVTLQNPPSQIPRLNGKRQQICDRPMTDRPARLRVWSTARLRRDRGLAEAVQEYEVLDELGTVVEKRELALAFALLDPRAFEREATAAGFTVLEVWGDYARAPFDPQTSPYAIYALG